MDRRNRATAQPSRVRAFSAPPPHALTPSDSRGWPPPLPGYGYAADVDLSRPPDPRAVYRLERQHGDRVVGAIVCGGLVLLSLVVAAVAVSFAGVW